MNNTVLGISNGGTTSNALNLYNYNSGVVIEMPAALTGTAITVYGSIDGTNYGPVYNDNVLLSFTFVASSLHVLSPVKLFGVTSIKLVSNGAEGAARSFNVVAIRPT